MNKILKFKHWQVFIGLMIFIVLYYVTALSNFSFNSISSTNLHVVFGIIGLILFFSWVMIVGLSLNSIKENPYHFRNVLLIFAILSCILGYGTMHLEHLFSNSFNSLVLLPVLVTPLTFLGIIYSFKNVAQSLKSIENGEKAKFKDYIVDVILLFVFPIGIWFIQPRLNDIYTVNNMIEDEK